MVKYRFSRTTKTVAKRAVKQSKKKATTYKKKRKYVSSKSATVSGLMWADKIFAKLKWAFTTYNTTGTLNTNYYFSINNPHDPDTSTGVGQTTALGYAIYVPIFLKNIVRGAKVTVIVKTISQDESSLMGVTVGPTEGANIGSAPFTTYAANPRFKTKTLSGVGSVGTFYYKNYLSMKKIAGLRDMKEDQNYAGGQNTSPQNLIYLLVNIQSMTTTNIKYILEVKITFYTEFYDRVGMLSYPSTVMIDALKDSKKEVGLEQQFETLNVND